MGRLQRRHGLTIDNLREVQLVSAEGRQLTANAGENADLFWALRGGGIFGIGVSFEFGRHPHEFPVTTRVVTYGGAAIRGVLDRYFQYAPTAPEPLFLAAVLVRNAQGAPLLNLSANRLGDPAHAESAFAVLEGFGTPLASCGGSMRYLDIQKQADGGANAPGHYEKKDHVSTIALFQARGADPSARRQRAVPSRKARSIASRYARSSAPRRSSRCPGSTAPRPRSSPAPLIRRNTPRSARVASRCASARPPASRSSASTS